MLRVEHLEYQYCPVMVWIQNCLGNFFCWITYMSHDSMQKEKYMDFDLYTILH